MLEAPLNDTLVFQDGRGILNLFTEMTSVLLKPCYVLAHL